MRYLNLGSVVAVLSASAMLVYGSRSGAMAAQPSLNPVVVAQAVEARKAEADRLFQQGYQQYQTSQFTAALQSWEAALKLYRELKDQLEEGQTLGNLGIAYQFLGNYGKAIEFHQQRLAIAQEIKDRLGEGQTLGNLGIAYQALGNYGKAIEFHQQSLAIAREIKNRLGEGASLGNLGGTYQALGNYGKAIEFHQQRLAIAREIKDRLGEGISLGNLGNAYAALSNYGKAIEFYQQSLAITREIKDRLGEGTSLGNLGLAHASLGNYGKAIEFHQKSLAIAREIKDRLGEGTSLGNLGSAYHALGNYGKAIEYFQQHLAIAREIKDRAGEGIVLSNLGNLVTKQQPELAIVFYKESVNVREGIRTDNRKLDRTLQESYTQSVAGTYRCLADLLLAQGQVLEAQQVLELLKIQELKDFDPAVRAKVDTTGKTIALDPAEQTIIGKHGTYVAFAQQLKQCEDKNEPCKDLRQQRKQAQAEYETAAQTFQQAFKDRKATDAKNFIDPNNPLIVKAQEIIRAQPNTALIYTLVTDDRLWIVLATQSEVFRSFEVKISQKDLSAKVKEFRDLIKRCEFGTCTTQDLTDFQAVSQQLYTWLFPQDLQKELQATQHLVFALDRVTRYIPMSALFDGKNYLIQNYTVATIVSADSTRSERLPSEAKNTKVLALGLSDAKPPDFPSPLLAVKGELDAIVQEEGNDRDTGSFPGRQFLNQQFTADVLEQYLPNRQILHIATHGEFVGGVQEQSYIVLGNGIKLRIAEMLKINGLPGVNLVVLSACQTALASQNSDGIEISSVGNAFFEKGVKSVVASLWNVNDSSTSLLMQQFYKNLAGGMTKSAALRQAQLTLLNTKTQTKTKDDRGVVQPETPNQPTRNDRPAAGYSHPYYWAPFILIGNGL